MALESGISWTDSTFNPWIGCARVSPACDGCYAAALMGMEGRHKRAAWGGPGAGVGTRSRTAPSTWRQPLQWNKEAARTGRPHFVFCASLADVFDNAVDPQWRVDLFDLIRQTPNLTWLLLTKRPGNIVKMVQRDGCPSGNDTGNYLPRNAAIGCTVVNQDEANRDVPTLLAAKALLGPAFAFLSMEPLLGPVDLQYPAGLWSDGPPMCCDGRDCGCLGRPTDPPLIWGVDWVITGGETTQGDHQARPQNPAWFRSIRDQCAQAGVAYHHKQNGEWASGIWAPAETPGRFAFGDYEHDPAAMLVVDHSPRQFTLFGSRCRMTHVGKETAGRLLDGVTHDARPEVRA